MSFNKLPPEDYCWSGYTDGREDFIGKNFSNCVLNGKLCYMCSAEIGIAIPEYLDRYVLDPELFAGLEEYLIDGMDYWFCLGWECQEQHYDELPDWCKSLVDLFIKYKLITRVQLQINEYDNDVIILYDTDLLFNYKQEINSIVHKAFADHDIDATM